MQIEKLNPNYLFKTHSKEEISNWASNLEYFYFIRAWGGHANDGDRFEAKINYSDNDDLLKKLSQLGIKLTAIPSNHPKPVIDKAYSFEEFEIFKNEIKDLPNFEQPEYIFIKSVRCFVWIESGEILITVSGTLDDNHYNVTNYDFEACKKLESFFDDLNFIDFKDISIEESANCISQKKYPELFLYQT